MGLAWDASFCPEVHEKLPSAIRRMRECSDILSGYMYYLSVIYFALFSFDRQNFGCHDKSNALLIQISKAR